MPIHVMNKMIIVLSLLLCVEHYGENASAFLLPHSIPLSSSSSSSSMHYRLERLPSITTKVTPLTPTAATIMRKKKWMIQHLSSSSSSDTADTSDTSDEPTKNEEEGILQELISLATQFESVSNTLQANKNLYNETVVSYEKQIDNLQHELNATQSLLTQSQQLLEESIVHVQELEEEAKELKKQEEEEMDEAQTTTNNIMESLRTDIMLKEESIHHLEYTIGRMEKQQEDLKKEIETLKEERSVLSATTPQITTTDGSVDVSAQQRRFELEKRDLFIEREKFRRLYTQELQKEKKIKIQEEQEYKSMMKEIAALQDQIESYELERKSMRKLTVLGLKRFGSILAFWKWFSRSDSSGDVDDTDSSNNDAVESGIKKDIVNGGGI